MVALVLLEGFLNAILKGEKIFAGWQKTIVGSRCFKGSSNCLRNQPTHHLHVCFSPDHQANHRTVQAIGSSVADQAGVAVLP